MPKDNLPELLKRIQSQELASNLSNVSLSPFSLEPKKFGLRHGGIDLNTLFNEIYSQEAKKLGLSLERYEYTCINELYKNDNPILETHYFMYDGGSKTERYFYGNMLGTALKAHTGIDIGEMFENICFSLKEVLYIYPTVDVGGYGVFHSFLNLLNSRLTEYNLFLAYVRERDDLSFRYGFNDHIGLIKGVPGEGLGKVTAGEVNLYPVRKIVKDKYYEVDIKGGILEIAPFATCNWELEYLEGFDNEEIGEMDTQEIPVKNREAHTFHFLNGATPHYFRHQTNEAMWTISRDGQPWSDD